MEERERQGWSGGLEERGRESEVAVSTAGNRRRK